MAAAIKKCLGWPNGAEKIEAESRGVSVYDLISELVAEAKPAPNAPLFHPFLHGSDVDPAARAGLRLTQAMARGRSSQIAASRKAESSSAEGT